MGVVGVLRDDARVWECASLVPVMLSPDLMLCCCCALLGCCCALLCYCRRFIDGYMALDTTRLGGFTFDELCASMGITPTEPVSSEYDEDEHGSEYEDEEEEGGEEGGDGMVSPTYSRPVSPGEGQEGV